MLYSIYNTELTPGMAKAIHWHPPTFLGKSWLDKAPDFIRLAV